jgi:hypothetical protein
MSAPAPVTGKADKGPAIISSKIMTNPEESGFNQLQLQEPTPSFISQKQVSANEQQQPPQPSSAITAARKR